MALEAMGPANLGSDAYLETWLRVRSLVLSQRERVGHRGISQVQTILKGDQHLDYSQHSEAFSAAYFGANYWKAASAFGNLPRKRTEHIVDLGAGSGAAALAATAY